MQGVVYGSRTKEINKYGLFTRFDIDEVYGTVLNRFVAESVMGDPLTVYGEGNQKRTFLSLEDSIYCLNLILNNPPDHEYKVYNQFDEYYSLNYLAGRVKEYADEILDKNVKIGHLEDPRVESGNHYYNPVNENLKKIGYRRQRSLDEELPLMLRDLNSNKNRLLSLRNVIRPKTLWK